MAGVRRQGQTDMCATLGGGYDSWRALVDRLTAHVSPAVARAFVRTTLVHRFGHTVKMVSRYKIDRVLREVTLVPEIATILTAPRESRMIGISG